VNRSECDRLTVLLTLKIILIGPRSHLAGTLTVQKITVRSRPIVILGGGGFLKFSNNKLIIFEFFSYRLTFVIVCWFFSCKTFISTTIIITIIEFIKKFIVKFFTTYIGSMILISISLVSLQFNLVDQSKNRKMSKKK
jgi:hypothetical protein